MTKREQSRARRGLSTWAPSRGVLALAAACVLALAGTAHAGSEPPFVPNEVVVRLAPGTQAGPLAASLGSVVLASIDSRNIHRLRVPVGTSEEDFASILGNDPRVVRVELNFIADDNPPGGTTQSIFIVERQAEHAVQAALASIGASATREHSTGAGVVVAVLDSGIERGHRAFRARSVLPGVDLVDNDTNPADVGDGIDNNGDGRVDEFVGHGTSVAGLVLRVAPGATILPIRVLDSDGGSTTFRVVDGMYRALDLRADVLNMSLGTIAASPLLEEALGEAATRGALVVASAGNDASGGTPRYPAAFSGPNVVSVAATRSNDVLASFSNWGTSVTLTAPGVGVVGPITQGRYGRANGTSFAAPLVSGTAALVKGIAPGLSMVQVRSRLEATSTPIDALNPDVAGEIGSGRLNAAAAVGAKGDTLPGMADINADRVVDWKDVALARQRPLDANADGVINAADIAAIEAFAKRLEWLDSGTPLGQ
jgi:subtilisin family serine protease